MVGSRFSEAYKNVTREIERIQSNFFDPYTILFFSDSSNFRKLVDPSYKGHRNRKKPCGYVRVINELTKEFEVQRWPGLEADDAIGIYATSNPDCIMVSPDKDLKQIPGTLFNLDETFTIDKQDGWEWFLIQTLSGDSTDGYSGAPGFGVKTSAKFFAEYGYTWNSVVRAYESKNLTEEDALRNARLAKILTAYDYEYGQPKLFDPTDAHYRNYDGTTVQVASDGGSNEESTKGTISRSLPTSTAT